MSWLTIDGLCCGKRQWLIFGTKCLPRGILGHIWDRISNGTYDFVYLVIIILKRVVDERLINQRCVWDGSSGVRCENWVRNEKVIGMSEFGVVLLNVWTWWGAWGQGSVYCGGWMICFRKSRKSGVWCSGDKINLLSGAYMLGRIVLRQIWCFRSPGMWNLKLCVCKKHGCIVLIYLCVRLW